MDSLIEDLVEEQSSPQIGGLTKIFFKEVLRGGVGVRRSSGCCGCDCMRDPELRDNNNNFNKNINCDFFTSNADQNPTTWPSSAGVTFQDSNSNNNNAGIGVHTDMKTAACHLLEQKHKSPLCVGLQHGKTEDKQRYHLEDKNRVITDNSNEVLRRIWCEQQAHGLTNLCYFISETGKLCFDALGVPCDQFYGWMDRGRSSFTHAWIKLGNKKQLIDITFYAEKSSKLPNGYWCDLGEYKLGPGPSSMTDETEFKKKHHWKYVYLCTLVEPRRDFLRCIFKFMMNEMQVQIPDVFKDASSSCWNCNTHLASSDAMTCDGCQSAVFCSEKCRAAERLATASHLEICADYEKRVKNKSLSLTKPAIRSLDELFKRR